MQTMQAVVMGLCQGLTEFLPVSSSAHIVLSSALFKLFSGANFTLVEQEEVFFDILVHLSTLFAILIYFYKEIKKLFIGFIKALFKGKFNDLNFKFGTYILSATFITCLIGFFIKDFAHSLVQNPVIVSFLLIVTGIMLLVCEKIKVQGRSINLKTALVIGFAQGLAVLPGLSRSGMTISSAMLRGVKKTDAAKFSFILSVPIIILASVIYPLLTFNLAEVKNFNYPAITLGMAVSFIVGYICIKFFMKFLEKGSLKCFACYCFIVGAACIVIFSIN